MRNNTWHTEKFRQPENYAIYQIPAASPHIDYDLVNGQINRPHHNKGEDDE